MNILKQSTAATVKLGAFVDDTDGKTAETGLTISQADIRLSKNGGDFAQTNNATGATHDEFGYYDIPLDTTDTGTLGRLRVAVSESGALPVWQDFIVVTANVYDSLFSTDKLDVAVVEMATDVLTAATVKADAVTKIQNGLATPTNITAGTITTTTNLTNLPAVTTDWLTADGVKADAVTKISVGVWTDTNTFAIDEKGFWLQTLYDDLVNGGRLDLLIDAIKAKTDNLPADPADDSDIDAQLAAIKAETAAILVDTGTTLDTKLNTIDGIVDDILVDTGTTLPATLATLAGYTDGIAGDVWSYAKRTLTHPSVSAEEPEDSNTLILYRDADIAIELTDLTIPAGAKKYIFTIKDNLDSGDDQAVLQASYAIDGSEVETNTLVYINSAAAPVLTNPVTFTLTDTNITIDLTAEAAALLPRYERGYLNWDLKLVTDASVTIVLQGLAQIIGTSTRAIE